MGKGLSTCKGCGITVPTEESVVCSGKKYCKSCGEIKVQEAQDYKDLIKLICEYLEIDIPTGLILKQVKEYKDELGYTYAGMSYSMWYAKEIKCMNFEVKYGIAILKYIYDEAKDYFMQQQKIQESVQINGKIEEKVREVKVTSRRQERKTSLMDLDKLIEEGEI